MYNIIEYIITFDYFKTALYDCSNWIIIQLVTCQCFCNMTPDKHTIRYMLNVGHCFKYIVCTLISHILSK